MFPPIYSGADTPTGLGTQLSPPLSAWHRQPHPGQQRDSRQLSFSLSAAAASFQEEGVDGRRACQSPNIHHSLILRKSDQVTLGPFAETVLR